MISGRHLLTLLALGIGSVVSADTGTGRVNPRSAPASAALVGRMIALLPSPDQSAQLMKLGSKVSTVNLQQRVAAVGGSPLALRTAMAAVAEGQLPAYDSRLGISRTEFAQYLAFQPVLLPGNRVKWSVQRTPARLTVLEMGGAAAVLRGLSFDLRTGEVQVPEGFTFRPVAVAPSTAKDRSIDLRGGVRWEMFGYDAESQNGIRGQLTLYQLGTAQVLLTYSRTNMLRGIPGEELSVMLTYATH